MDGAASEGAAPPYAAQGILLLMLKRSEGQGSRAQFEPCRFATNVWRTGQRDGRPEPIGPSDRWIHVLGPREKGIPGEACGQAHMCVQIAMVNPRGHLLLASVGNLRPVVATGGGRLERALTTARQASLAGALSAAGKEMLAGRHTAPIAAGRGGRQGAPRRR